MPSVTALRQQGALVALCVTPRRNGGALLTPQGPALANPRYALLGPRLGLREVDPLRCGSQLVKLEK
ncbi:hypothetical protein NK936_23965 [Salmonella enterica subsp. enterica serovar Typhimurium]|uniref:hypothetical protein n=1 Tax=Salmonella enterica TaxID=28901 RepID=UPI0020A3935F|nr:hypothetical protein [Salmonella enterica]MCP2802688.1 hypothetical protein [Salmonella enterica subsp. enterica serovar Typhimurium]